MDARQPMTGKMLLERLKELSPEDLDKVIGFEEDEDYYYTFSSLVVTDTNLELTEYHAPIVTVELPPMPEEGSYAARMLEEAQQARAEGLLP